MKVTFWGVRGSFPCPGPEFSLFGAHTSCVSLEINDEIFIFDAGTGITDCGTFIRQSSYKKAHLFFSHYHLDHVMGLPFFWPLWDHDFDLMIYGPPANNQPFDQYLHSLFSPPLFPVPLKSVPARLKFIPLIPDQSFAVNNQSIETIALHHPGGSLGYRLQDFCYLTDLEHDDGPYDENLKKFMNDAKLVVFDSTYSEEEYASRKGWGHCTIEKALSLCQQALVKKTAFFHHDLHHKDDVLLKREKKAQEHWPACFMARQGMFLDL